MLKYKLVKRSDPRNGALSPKWFASPQTRGRVSMDALCADIALGSSLSRGDITNALICLMDTIPKYLRMGYTVELGEVGTLFISFSSEGVEEETDFHTGLVNHMKVRFLASPKLKKTMEKTGFERK